MVIKLLYILKTHFMVKKTRKIPKLENVKMSLTGLKDNQYAVWFYGFYWVRKFFTWQYLINAAYEFFLCKVLSFQFYKLKKKENCLKKYFAVCFLSLRASNHDMSLAPY